MPGVYGFIKKRRKGLGLWCLTPLSTIFQLYRGGKRRKEKNRKKVIFKCNFAAFIHLSLVLPSAVTLKSETISQTDYE
jgi:hypothetical protein